MRTYVKLVLLTAACLLGGCVTPYWKLTPEQQMHRQQIALKIFNAVNAAQESQAYYVPTPNPVAQAIDQQTREMQSEQMQSNLDAEQAKIQAELKASTQPAMNTSVPNPPPEACDVLCP